MGQLKGGTYVGGDLTIANNIVAGGTLTTNNDIYVNGKVFTNGKENTGDQDLGDLATYDYVDKIFLKLTGGTITGSLYVNDTTNSSSTTTGAIRTSGGLGVVGNAYFGGTIGANGTLNVVGAVTAYNTINAYKDTPAGTAYHELGIQVYSGDGSPVGIGFHRGGYSQTILEHNGDGLTIRSSSTIGTGAYGNLTVNDVTASNYHLSLTNQVRTNSEYLELVSAGNEICIGGSAAMHVNYRPATNGTPTNWYWRAGSSTSFANFYIGGLVANGVISSGNVLIGTTTDSGYKLNVNGTIYSSGNITTPGIVYTNGKANTGDQDLGNLSTYSYVDNTFLNLTGGTMTGSVFLPLDKPALRFGNARSWDSAIAHDTASYEVEAFMSKYAGSKYRFKVGFDPVNFANGTFVNMTNADLEIGAGYCRINNNIVWHAGNDGSGSGLDADTLDGVHNGNVTANYFKRQTTSLDANNPSSPYMWFYGQPEGNRSNWASGEYGGIFTTLNEAVDLNAQFNWSINHDSETPTNSLFFRVSNNRGFKNDWKQIAFTTSNVASATKLSTSRLIWGQTDTDGTGNISGNLSNVHHITSSGYYYSTISGVARTVIDYHSGGVPIFGYGTARAGLDTHLDGNNIRFYTASSRIEVMNILSSGNVLIGTGTDSGYKLDVNGTLRATGAVILGSTLNVASNGFFGGTLNALSIGITNTSSSSGKGLSLYNGATDGKPTYGLFFGGTSTFGNHGAVTGDWATYFTMSDDANRGWIFQRGSTNVASISNGGNAKFNGALNVVGAVTAYNTINAYKDTPAGTAYHELGIQVYSGDGSPVGIGFHRGDYSQTILEHSGDGLTIRSSSTIGTGAYGNLTVNDVTASNYHLSLTNQVRTNSGYLELVSAGNEICIGGSAAMHVNYRPATNGTPTNWYWRAGSSTSFADFYVGGLVANGVISSNNRIFTGYDSGETNSISCSNWFRSNGQTGWYNATYGGGIWMSDSTYVKVYGNKIFKVTSTASDSINTDGGVLANGEIRSNSKFSYGSSAYSQYNSTTNSIDFIFN